MDINNFKFKPYQHPPNKSPKRGKTAQPSRKAHKDTTTANTMDRLADRLRFPGPALKSTSESSTFDNGLGADERPTNGNPNRAIGTPGVSSDACGGPDFNFSQGAGRLFGAESMSETRVTAHTANIPETDGGTRGLTSSLQPLATSDSIFPEDECPRASSTPHSPSYRAADEHDASSSSNLKEAEFDQWCEAGSRADQNYLETNPLLDIRERAENAETNWSEAKQTDCSSPSSRAVSKRRMSNDSLLSGIDVPETQHRQYLSATANNKRVMVAETVVPPTPPPSDLSLVGAHGQSFQTQHYNTIETMQHHMGLALQQATEKQVRAGSCDMCRNLYAALVEATGRPQVRCTEDSAMFPLSKQSARDVDGPHYDLRGRTSNAKKYVEDCSDGYSNSDGESDAASDIAPSLLKRSRAYGNRRRWTVEDDRKLRKWKANGKPDTWIADQLGRSESAVQQQFGKPAKKRVR